VSELLSEDRPTTLAEAARLIRGPGSELRRFLSVYYFGLQEMLTKVEILREELRLEDDDCPIEHVGSRLKSFESLTAKVARKGLPLELDAVRESVLDVAGIRVVCSFVSDVYLVADMLTRQPDVEVLETKDYIAVPKANGYKSLHLIVRTPVHLSTGPVWVPVELQLRTVAMDSWASLEHKVFYKWDRDVPAELRAELLEAAHIADRLDATMQRLHREVRATAP
ncbi:RelA/SpoT protein, partial [Klenkia terrae]